ncbi:MAG: hypothetical protein HQK89_01840 [Nitrospirae bacterium]|nr:hypothetical protein [Nitrospirota bacterium]
MAEPYEKNYHHKELQLELQRQITKYESLSKLMTIYRRWIFIYGGVAMGLVLPLILIYVFFHGSIKNEYFAGLILILLFMALGAVFALYLKPSVNNRDDVIDADKYFLNLDEISDIFKDLKNGGKSALEFTEAYKARVLSNFQLKLESESLQSYVSDIKKLVLAQVREESFDERFNRNRRRLREEVQDLKQRGTLNLIIGILTTIAGLLVLGLTVFNTPATHSASELLAYFVPRVSLVVLIEVFAYFFLRLYKQSIGEIKYFQNEITNIEAKQIAMQLTLRIDNENSRIKMAEELAKTERNFILTKDQTTVELERERMARTTNSGITDAIKEVITVIKGFSKK